MMRKLKAWLCGLAVAAAAMTARADRTNVPPPPMPPVPQYQKVNDSLRLHELSPVAYFRVLLGMAPAQRERLLAGKSAEARARILRKVAEYEALPAAIREARLRQTELRWTLIDLMKMPPAQRATRLRVLLPADRVVIDARLRQWDILPPAAQKAYLEKESFISFYLRWQAASPVGQIEIMSKLPAANRREWMEELNRWQALPEAKRQEMCDRLTQFFTMDDQQKKASVAALSDEERRQMENSLRAFAHLPPAERRQCVASFGKFATMKADERDQFLRNAARWEEMTPAQRRLWRQLVRSLPLQPPLPPGFKAAAPGGLPPLPPGFTAADGSLAPRNVYARFGTN